MDRDADLTYLLNLANDRWFGAVVLDYSVSEDKWRCVIEKGERKAVSFNRRPGYAVAAAIVSMEDQERRNAAG